MACGSIAERNKGNFFRGSEWWALIHEQFCINSFNNESSIRELLINWHINVSTNDSTWIMARGSIAEGNNNDASVGSDPWPLNHEHLITD